MSDVDEFIVEAIAYDARRTLATVVEFRERVLRSCGFNLKEPGEIAEEVVWRDALLRAIRMLHYGVEELQELCEALPRKHARRLEAFAEEARKAREARKERTEARS